MSPVKPVRVLVVDDSALIRQLLSRLLNSCPGIEVAGIAVNGKDALDRIKMLKPDVVTLDVEMPVLDGLSALRRIMQESPLPVIMFSTLTAEGTSATIEALTLGAFDFVTKPANPAALQAMATELTAKIMAAAASSRTGAARRPAVAPRAAQLALTPAARTAAGTRLVVIGTSTGGPAALYNIIPSLPKEFPAPVVVVQHISTGFTKPLAENLGKRAAVPVREAAQNDPVLPGQVLIAPAGWDLYFRGRPGSAKVALERGGPLPPGGFRPSVDVVMTSAAQVYGGNVIGVVMTGMGRDGVLGMTEVKKRQGRTIAEAESTCVVYGMPRAVVEAGVADRVVPQPQIVREIMAML